MIIKLICNKYACEWGQSADRSAAQKLLQKSLHMPESRLIVDLELAEAKAEEYCSVVHAVDAISFAYVRPWICGSMWVSMSSKCETWTRPSERIGFTYSNACIWPAFSLGDRPRLTDTWKVATITKQKTTTTKNTVQYSHIACFCMQCSWNVCARPPIMLNIICWASRSRYPSHANHASKKKYGSEWEKICCAMNTIQPVSPCTHPLRAFACLPVGTRRHSSPLENTKHLLMWKMHRQMNQQQ